MHPQQVCRLDKTGNSWYTQMGLLPARPEWPQNIGEMGKQKSQKSEQR